MPWAWGGGISTLFAYGQTGSGKTYTIDALAKQAAEHLFGDDLEGKRDVYLSCFELAGNVASGAFASYSASSFGTSSDKR